MAFWEKEPVPRMISLNHKMTERTNYTYLGYKLSIQGEVDLSQKNYKINNNYGYYK
jgi:hypothetical protein